MIGHSSNLFVSLGGAEPPANSDHRLVVATAALQPYRATRKSFKPHPDSALLMQNSDLADRYDITVDVTHNGGLGTRVAMTSILF